MTDLDDKFVAALEGLPTIKPMHVTTISAGAKQDPSFWNWIKKVFL